MQMVMDDRLPKKSFNGSQLRGMSQGGGGYNTTQSGIPGQGYNTQGSTSGFGKPGGYQTGTSQFSMDTQGGNVRKHSRLIEKAKMFMHHEKLNQERVPINRNQPKGKKLNRKSQAAQEMPIGPDGKPMTKE